MVLQVAKDVDKEKEEYSEVPLPLPVEGGHVEDTGFQDPTVQPRKRKLQVCKTFSIALNFALILAVILLTVKVCGLKRELRDVKERDEYEMKPTNVVDHKDTMDVTGSVDEEAHDRIKDMETTYGNGWYTEIKIILCFSRKRKDSWLRFFE